MNPEQDKIIRASQVLFDYEALSMVPRPEAAEVLSALKLKGYKIGLISDCSSETVALWENTGLKPFFEVTIFSCAVGIKETRPAYLSSGSRKVKSKTAGLPVHR